MHQKQRAVGESENLEGENFDFIPANKKWGGISDLNLFLLTQKSIRTNPHHPDIFWQHEEQ